MGRQVRRLALEEPVRPSETPRGNYSIRQKHLQSTFTSHHYVIRLRSSSKFSYSSLIGRLLMIDSRADLIQIKDKIEFKAVIRIINNNKVVHYIANVSLTFLEGTKLFQLQ